MKLFTRLKRVCVFSEFRINAIMEEKYKTTKINATTHSTDKEQVFPEKKTEKLFLGKFLTEKVNAKLRGPDE
jgi:hypothetical protein